MNENAELCDQDESVRVVFDPRVQRHVLLAIDTSIGTSVAIGYDGRIIEAASGDPLRHAEVIGELISMVLEEAGVQAAAITGVVSGVGPGPFTGLRVGIAAARTFALGAAVPVHPIVSHEAVALSTFAESDATLVRVVQDAKRRELFVSEYRAAEGSHGVPELVAAPHIMPREGFAERSIDVWPARIPAARLVEAANLRLQAPDATFAAAEALYLRQPDVAQPAGPKRVST